MISIEILKGCGGCHERNKDIPEGEGIDCILNPYTRPMTFYLSSGQTVEDLIQISCTCPGEGDISDIQLGFMDQEERTISINAADIVAFSGWKD